MIHKTKRKSKKSRKSSKTTKKHGRHEHMGHEGHMGHEDYGIPKEVLEEASAAASKVIHDYLVKNDNHEVEGAFAPLLIPLALKLAPAAFSAVKKYGPGMMNKYGPEMFKKAQEMMHKKE